MTLLEIYIKISRTTIKLTQEAIDAGNDGCTAGGHDGRLYSKCWDSCEDGYDMIFKVCFRRILTHYKNN